MTDEEALELAKSGRREGFTAIYERYAGSLFTVALRILRRREAAEDALQEAFAAAFRSIREFRGESRLKTWLYSILFRSALKQKSRDGVHPIMNTEPPDSVAPPGPSVDDRLMVRQILDRLEERDRTVLLMAYWEGFSCAEIAEVLEVQPNHVKILLYRARGRFSRLWLENSCSTQTHLTETSGPADREGISEFLKGARG
ncbi:MAG: RNA polymerase sigma factor [Candidatus Riflebacteria bacterium]|nr:RNA polymerase sigma factor [Candidatus Riflebacteria bacterium]